MTHVLLTVTFTFADIPRGMVPLSMAMTSNWRVVYLRYTSSQRSKLSLKSTGGLKKNNKKNKKQDMLFENHPSGHRGRAEAQIRLHISLSDQGIAPNKVLFLTTDLYYLLRAVCPNTEGKYSIVQF